MFIEFIVSDLYVCSSFAKSPLQVLFTGKNFISARKIRRSIFFFEKKVLFKILDLKSDGVKCRLQVTGCRLQVAGCRLQVAGCRLQVRISRQCGRSWIAFLF